MRLQRIGKNARLAAAIAMTLFSASVSAVYAMPTDGVVKSGEATISSVVDNTMNINQTTDRVAIDWTSFDIAANETVNFAQPNANSIALNRVTGNDVSEIYGALNANGKVFLLNTSGILFAEGASVNVNGLVASTGELKDINNTNKPFDVTKFADGKDFILEVQNDHGKPENPAVINRADINARINEEGGLVVLHAINVENHGTITTGNGGIVQLAAGKKLKVNYDSDKVNFAVTVDDKSGLKAADVLNAGTISAQNGIIAMTARGLDKVVSSVVNTDGARLEAKGLAVNGKGEIILEAATVGKTPDKSWGVVDMGGTIDASGVNGADGGTITAKARSISIDGTLDASGANSGTIAPEYSGLLVTDNAKINVAAANGTNGKFTVNTEATVDIKSAATGLNRTDADYTKSLYAAVGRDNVVISNVALSNMLTGTDVDITAHNAKHLVSDIFISGDVTKTGDKETTLKLTADRNVVFEGAVTSDKKLNVTTETGSPIMLEQGTRDGERFGANIIWKNINTKGDINLGGNTFVGILDGTSESGRGISGNNVTLGGDVVVAVADTLEINAEKDAKIEGSVNSGNAYTGGSIEELLKKPSEVVKVNGKTNYWETARKAAKNGTEGGSAVGDSYLVTITDGLEDSAVAAVLPSREKKAYTGGKASSKLVYDEANGTTTREWRWADGPEAGQLYFVQTSEMNRGTGYSTKAVSGYATTDGTTDTKGYTNFSSGDPNNDGTNGQTVMSVGFNNSNPGWSGYGEDYTMSRWDDAYEDMGSSYLLYIRETNLAESSLRINAGGDIEVKGPIGDKRGLDEVVLDAGRNYRFNPDDAAVIKLQITEMMASPSAVQGSAGIEAADSARVSGVEKVAGLMDGQLPFYKAKDDRIIPGGVLEISATPDTVKVKVNPAAEGIPDISKVKDANQYREYQKMLDTVDGAADFKLTYNGASFEIYPVDRNAQAVLQKGDSAGNMDVTAAALHAAFSEMGLSLEDMAAVCVHMNA